MSYDYVEESKKIKEIVNSPVEIQSIPNISNSPENITTFNNGVRSWIASIFVDIVDSSTLFKNQRISDKVKARILRCFCDGLIKIFNDNDKSPIDVGIRGDAVFAVYNTPLQEDVVNVFRIAYMANTFMKMLNKILEQKQWPTIKAGIGLSCSEDLIIKAGVKRQYSDYIWIGSALLEADKLSKIANRKGNDPIAMSSMFFSNIIDSLTKEEKAYQQWIRRTNSYEFDSYFYQCNIINTDFNSWVDKYL